MCLLGCDIGSSSVKASIVDKDTGLTLASDFYPKEEAAIKAVRPGWAEQDPDDWWMYLKEAIKGAIAKAGIKGTEIDAIGISYQMHGLVYFFEICYAGSDCSTHRERGRHAFYYRHGSWRRYVRCGNCTRFEIKIPSHYSGKCNPL